MEKGRKKAKNGAGKEIGGEGSEETGLELKSEA